MYGRECLSNCPALQSVSGCFIDPGMRGSAGSARVGRKLLAVVIFSAAATEATPGKPRLYYVILRPDQGGTMWCHATRRLPAQQAKKDQLSFVTSHRVFVLAHYLSQRRAACFPSVNAAIRSAPWPPSSSRYSML